MSTIKVKRRHTTGGTPSIVDGELSINSFDKKIFIGNGSTAVEIANQLGYSTISTVGTITSGTWQGSAIGTAYGGTGQTVYAVGDLLYASTTTALSKLTIGANNYVLTSDGTNPVWSANTGTGSVVRASSPTITSPSITTSITTGSTSFDVFDTTATTINAFGAATTLNLGQDASSGTTTTNINVKDGGTSTVNIATGSAGTRTINLATGNTAGSNRTINFINSTKNNIISNNDFDEVTFLNYIDTNYGYGTVNILANATGSGLYDINYVNIGTIDLTDIYLSGNIVVYSNSGLTIVRDNFSKDRIIILPINSGASFRSVTITNEALTVSRTFTLPNVNGTAITTGNLTSITTTGTIGTGTWQGTAIGEIYGGTAQTSYAAGDLLYASATNTLSKLTKPASTTSFLKMTSAGVPSWDSTVVTTGDTGTVTNTMLAGSIANNKLANSAITINSSSTSLGGSITLYLGTTTLQTSSANQAVTGITSITYSDNSVQSTAPQDYLLFAMGII